jgi:uncharacterized BrkB/YihY/UPF0761 family membrane protein
MTDEPKTLVAQLQELIETGPSVSPKTQEVQEKPYNQAEQRDKLRVWIAKALFFLISFFVAFSLIFYVVSPEKYKDIKDILTVVFSPLITLFGTVLGFYFGGNTDTKQN